MWARLQLQDVDRATQEHGLATVLGFISEVGVAGLTLGGGLGYLARRFGWTVDNLQEVDIVTADGPIRTAHRDENAELFWALRGGGGNFGVVTRFTFRLHEVGPMVHGGLVAWPFDRADDVMRAYKSMTAEAPRELATWLLLIKAPPRPSFPPSGTGKICGMCICYSGDLARTEEIMAPIRALGDPVVDLLADMPYTQVQSYLNDTAPKGMHYYWRTGYLAQLDDELLANMRDVFADCPIPEPELGFLHLKARSTSTRKNDGAVGNRDARYVMGVNGMWAGDLARRVHAVDPIRLGAASALLDRPQLRQLPQRGRGGRARVRATYGTNYERLAAAKQAYDPGNLFRMNRNVPPG